MYMLYMCIVITTWDINFYAMLELRNAWLQQPMYLDISYRATTYRSIFEYSSDGWLFNITIWYPQSQEEDLQKVRDELNSLRQEEVELEQKVESGRMQLEQLAKNLNESQAQINQVSGCALSRRIKRTGCWAFFIKGKQLKQDSKGDLPRTSKFVTYMI